jgi:hypothetical protein
MSSANERQHGGGHYKKNEYQHWDFVCDTHQPYLVGCATKYASRWRDKGGTVDLQKMAHYLDKAEERGVTVLPHNIADVERFAAQLDNMNDRMLITYIMNGQWTNARTLAHTLIQFNKEDV